SFFILESYHTPAGRGKRDFLSSLSFLALTKNEPGDATPEPHHEHERNARLISEQKSDPLERFRFGVFQNRHRRHRRYPRKKQQHDVDSVWPAYQGLARVLRCSRSRPRDAKSTRSRTEQM